MINKTLHKLQESKTSKNHDAPAPRASEEARNRSAARPEPARSSSETETPKKEGVRYSPELSEELKKRSQSQKAEATDANAQIAVFDSFNGADDPGNTTHGELVEGVLLEQGFKDEDIQRYQVGGGASIEQLAEDLANGDPEALDAYIEQTQTGLLDSTSDALEEVLDDPDSKITTINQSQSQAEARVTKDLWEKAKDDPEFRSDLSEQLGLPENASDADLAQALVNRVDGVVENSEAIKDSKARYDELSQEASERGINHVVTAGNLGRFQDELRSLGVKTDANFYRSHLANDYTTVVGGTDGQGTESGRDDTNAGFNATAGAEISAPGVDYTITTADGATETVDGTSFAAPQVAAADAMVASAAPDLTPQEREDLLIDTSTQITTAPQSDIGAGVLNTDMAVMVAALERIFG